MGERKRALALVALAGLAGCDRASVSADPAYDAEVSSGRVALAAEAPDGTKLWAVTPPGSRRRVYFASSGTHASHVENCGKNCNRTVSDAVPTVELAR